ncbi:MAG TPA: hypothetical protein VKX17_05815 [Planctomycetota bacterium]|nr:hypothetical protein [Planctomycetota bacterium]
MRRRLLIITKDPEFDMRGEVVLGQCEPFTSGWTMYLIYPDGKRENLVTGTYSDLRKIQEGCIGIDDPDVVRKRVLDMRMILIKSVTETVAVGASKMAQTPDREPTKELEPLPSSGEQP